MENKTINKEVSGEQLLREKVLQAEQERLNGAKTIIISEARKRLRERIIDNNE